MKNWFDVTRPHEDIRKGHLDEAVFAAIRSIQSANADAEPDQIIKDVLEAQQAVRRSMAE